MPSTDAQTARVDDRPQSSPESGPPTGSGRLPERMLHPRSVALVGASGRADSLTARPLRYLIEHGFEGEIYPVNPNYDELQGVLCYPDLAALPGPVDLVLVMVPASATPQVVRDAGRAGAAGAVVYGSGFAETGPAGQALQEELLAAGRESGVRVLGPNCQGLIHAPSGLLATFTAAADRPLEGRSGVAYVGQSGAVGGSVLDLATEMGLALTAWVSTGNQADLDLVEVAESLVEEDDVRVVMLYAETIADGAAYTRLARRTQELRKHLVVLLSGRSEAGRRAAASHTGSMLGDDVAFVLASQRHGVVLVDDVDELLSVAATVGGVRDVSGRRVGVVTTSGGAGSLAADHCAVHDLQLPELGDASQQRLAPLVPDFGALANPVDVTAQLFNREGSARALGDVCDIVADDPDIDLVAVVLTMVTGELGRQLAEDLVDTAERLDKPLLVTWLAGQDQTVAGRAVFRAAGMPVFRSVGDMARAAGLLAPPEMASAARPAAEDAGPADAPETEALRRCLDRAASDAEVLDVLGISSPRAVVARSREEAAEAAGRCDGTVALKLHAGSVGHKSDLGGVRLDVSPGDVPETFDALMELASARDIPDVEGVLVQEMVPSGVELLLGVTSTADGYAPVITVGMGGVTTEIYRDVISDLAPVTPTAAEAIASLSRAAAGLAGRRFEVEINPLIVADEGGGAHAVDLLASGSDHAVA